MLAQAGQQRLVRQLREHAKATRRSQRPSRRITRLLKRTRPAALPHDPYRSRQQPPELAGPVMPALIALAAICLFAAGAVAGITGMVAVGIQPGGPKPPPLTSQAPDTVTCAGRRLTGLHVRPRPHRHR